MTEMNTPASPSAVRRWWIHVLDGRHDWGFVDTSPTRHGVTRYRLVVFPPGMDVIERRLLRAWRAWPTWGAVLWVLAQVLMGPLLTPATALVASTLVYLGVGAVLFAQVAELRTRVRTLAVVRMAGYPDPHSAETFADLKALAAELCRADALRDAGESSPADHETTWWRVYERLGRVQNGSVIGRAASGQGEAG